MIDVHEIIVIAHNIRSIHNIGSLFRTAEGLGVARLILSGYSPYPRVPDDRRLPHVIEKQTRQIHKTALGAETLVPFEHRTFPDLEALRQQGYAIIGLEQAEGSIRLSEFKPPERMALLLGEEVLGIDHTLLGECDAVVEIPMHGVKESFNVSVAAGIALYSLSVQT
jgi:tRNA G18 (ribose-2'-O)-methylase SpoU